MNNELQVPPLTAWLLAAMPVAGLVAYYNPETEMLVRVFIIGACGVGLYRIARWAVAKVKASTS